MKKYVFLIIIIGGINISISQEIVNLPYDKPTETVWQGSEKEYFSDLWQTQVVTNVSIPTLRVFRAENPNGTCVIVAPGGGLYALSINSEGNEVAKWLNKKGITAFVLKYRLVPTGADGVKEIMEVGDKLGGKVGPVLPLSVADGLAAISHVRTNADTYGVNPNTIGFMGFSAGGTVTMGVTFNYTQENRPDFIVPVYPWTTVMGEYKVPADAPPMLVICATDDPLGLAQGSVDLYSNWLKNSKTTGLHMYSKGGHGFGMKKQGLPSDDWISRFHEWSIAEGITVK